MVSIDDFTEILLDEAKIQSRVKELAHQITEDYKGRSLIVLTVMKGADNFSRDLRREIVKYSLKTYKDIVVDIIQDIVIMSLYEHPDRKKERPDKILGIGPHIPYENNDVLIVEDIVDRGLTMRFLKIEVLIRNPKSISLCSLLSKPDQRLTHVDIDYLGFEVPNQFVVGYGLDFEGRYRDLPFIGVLKKEVYEKK